MTDLGHRAVAGHTRAPLTEALVLGIGGGLGAGYILGVQAARYGVLGFRNRWRYVEVTPRSQDRGVEERVAARHRPDRREDVLGSGVLEQEPAGPRPERAS